MSTNIEIVRDYLAAWHDGEAEGILAHFTDDISYRDIPQPEPHRGFDVNAYRIRTFQKMVERAQMQVHDIAESVTGTVFTQRSDQFLINGKWLVMEVVGVTRFRDNKICEWIDYWDSRSFETQMTEITGAPFSLSNIEPGGRCRAEH